MFKVLYKGEVVNVLDVNAEYGLAYYCGESTFMPTSTWFLLQLQNEFAWVKSSDCDPVEQECFYFK